MAPMKKVMMILGQNEQPVVYDFWGRRYEDSTYQWLPTYFAVDDNGKCTIEDYINNLVPRNQYSDLYQCIEKLFEAVLPCIESVYAYVRSVRPCLIGDSEYEDDMFKFPSMEHVSLRGQTLQVITKIVDYELKPGQSHDGVYHLEGMSHEEIVLTCLYILDRDDDIDGGELMFQRTFLGTEASFLEQNLSWEHPKERLDLVGQGRVPLGTAETPKGRLMVFPNSHIHKVSRMINNTSPTDAKPSNGRRRTVVFFLVNPCKRILSTREVPPQQQSAGGTMTLDEAKSHRLRLMHERKHHKQSFNVRTVHFCEH